MANFASVFGGWMAGPGINAPVETAENTFYWNNHYLNVFDQGNFDTSTTDGGNTTTTVLRPGLLLGKVYSTGLVTDWNPAGTDGSQYIWGVLTTGMSMTDSLGATGVKRFRGGLMIRGAVKPSKLLIGGNASYGIVGDTYELLVRTQLAQRGFLLLDDPVTDSLLANSKFFGNFTHLQAKTADYTVKAYESGTLFTTRGASGAVNFTLPTTATLGLHYGFYCAADQNLTVTSGTTDKIVAINDLAADSVAFSTSSLKIGGMIEVFGDGTGWLTRISAGQTSDGTTSGQLVTVAT